MPGVARVGDKTNAEGDRYSDGEWMPAAATKGAKTVFCEGKAVLVLESPFASQKKEKDEPVMDKETGEQKVDEKTGELVWKTKTVDRRSKIIVESASSSVFAEGTPIARQGDSLTYGLTIDTASETVFAE